MQAYIQGVCITTLSYPFMETTTSSKAWQKPEIYLLDSDNIEGGANTFNHEVNNGNRTLLKNHNGTIIHVGATAYMTFAHS